MTGLLLVAEPVVIVAARLVTGGQRVVHWTLTPGPYVAEAVLGVLVLAATALRRAGRSANARPGQRL